MDHKWLEDFVVLAGARNFSRAAELRHVTQPQFSRRVRALEMWVGADLFDRSRVPLELTPAGEEFLPTARLALSNLEDTRLRIRSCQNDQNWVVLGTGRTLSRTMVPSWLARVVAEIGDFKLRILTGAVNELVTALEQGRADFILCFSHPRLSMLLDDNRFSSLTLGTDELIAVSAPGPSGKPLHALPGTTSRPVRFLNYAPTLALSQILRDGLMRSWSDVHLQPVVESDFAESLHEHALAGAGMAWLPRALVQPDLNQSRLVRAETSEASIRYEICLYYPKSPRNPLVQRITAVRF